VFDKLNAIEVRYDEIEKALCQPEVISDVSRFKRYSKERAEIEELVEAYRVLRRVTAELEDNRTLLNEKDPEIRKMAEEEIAKLETRKEALLERIKVLLLPPDPNDGKNILLEIRAGTGGEEAALFASDLFRMYSRFAERQNWKVEILSMSGSDAGGIKELISLMSGKGVYSQLKYESGVHRVQRVPTTEAQGRIHTSAVTVAVLPEAEDVEVQIEEKDLRVDVMRSGGPGGQSVNTTDSAVRITHLPSGIVVHCQDEKSQHKNKAKAMKILRARLLDRMETEQQARMSADRKSQVGTGDRSERIRTYNFPQNRVTDHRVGLTLHRLGEILEGDIEEIITKLRTHFQAEALRQERTDTTREQGE